MIDIRKINDVKTADKLANEFRLKLGSDDFLLGAFSHDDVIGFIQYEICGDKLKIKFISCISDDFALADGLIKALLFKCDVSIVRVVTLPCKYEQTAKSLGFTLNNGVFVLKLSEYSNHCHM